MPDKIKSFRKNGNIVIEIPENALISGVENNLEALVKVIEKETFLNFISDYLVEEIGFDNNTGLSSFYRLLDEAAETAIERDKGVDVG